MLSSQLSIDQPVGSKRPRMRSESRRAKKGNSTNLESVELIQQEAKGELIEVPDSTLMVVQMRSHSTIPVTSQT